MGLSYKKNVGDTRESPPVEIFDKLIKLGALADFSDPYLEKFPKMKKFNYSQKSVKITKQNLEGYDLAVILTDHDEFDFELILENSKKIVDTRGCYYRLGIQSEKIIIS